MLGEPPTLNTPENLVVGREGLNFSPIYLAHTKVSSDFLAWRLCDWKTPDIKMLFRWGVKMENHIELKNKVLPAGLQRVYNTDKIFGNQCAFFFPLSFFILASFQLGSSYHLLPDHTLLLGRWSTPSCGQSGRCFWEPGWSHKWGQRSLLQWLGQPRRSETQFQAQLIHEVSLLLKLFWKSPLRTFTTKFAVKTLKLQAITWIFT